MKSQIFLVLGDNGSGNSGNSIFGIYPTAALANARRNQMESLFEEGEAGTEWVWVICQEVGPEGVDCEISVEG